MTKWRYGIISLVAAAALLFHTPSTVGAVAAPAASTAVGTHLVEVRTQVTVHNFTRDPAKNLVITLPPTVANQIGQQRVIDVKFIQAPASTRKTGAGMEATYRVSEVAPGETLTFEQAYTVELAAHVQAAVTASVDAAYLATEDRIEVGHPAIQAAAQTAVAGISGVDQQAKALIQSVVDRLDYDRLAASSNNGALAGYESGKGVCEEYASLFVAMSRAAGIPARLVYGWADDTGLPGSLTGGNRHVWAEYFHPDQGWVSVDPTFAEGQQDLLFFDPATHIAQDFANTGMTASFGGRGLVGIQTEQSVTGATQIAHP